MKKTPHALSPQPRSLSLEPRLPPEWAPHEGTFLAFPHHRTDFPGKLSAVVHTFAEMARVISQKEKVYLLVRDASEKRRAQEIFLAAGVRPENLQLILQDTNRSWTRDSMPLFVKDAGRGRVAVKFQFDGWSRYRDYKKDDAAGRAIAKKFGSRVQTPVRPSGALAVLEGGSIDVDGEGTLLTTRECLISSARARFVEGQETAEAVLTQALGVKKVLWLENGIAGDDTSGHVDDFARFAPGGKLLLCQETRRTDQNYAPLKKAALLLRGAKNARGKALKVVGLPMPEPVYYRGERLPASYANFYICNAAVLVPVFNDPMDAKALALIQACFPDRPAVGIYARDLVVGLGTLHCSTMQLPR